MLLMTCFKLIFISLLAIFLTVPTFATHKISMRQAKSMAANANRNSGIPIEMNELVLKQLNRFLSTPGGRSHMRTCFKRMKSYKHMISGKLKKQNLPQELMAIPIIESGYQNIHSKHGWGSGLWMFVKATAKSYGLKINGKVDQRLNVRLSTDAALKYLKGNHKRFDDWHLALLAYNMGEFRVKKAMKQTGSKDAWKIIRAGHEGDKGYLAKVMAVMIIMKNPDVL